MTNVIVQLIQVDAHVFRYQYASPLKQSKEQHPFEQSQEPHRLRKKGFYICSAVLTAICPPQRSRVHIFQGQDQKEYHMQRAKSNERQFGNFKPWLGLFGSSLLRTAQIHRLKQGQYLLRFWRNAPDKKITFYRNI